MQNNNVGAWLVQETWEEGDEFDVEVGGYHIFCHISTKGKDGRWHLFKGIGIILSPQFYAAWRAVGSPPPITIPNEDFVGQFIQLNVKFDSYNSRGKRIKGKSLTIALISVYFLCDGAKHEQFSASFDSMLNSINSNTMVMIGSDINARIGIRTCEEHASMIGPHGIERSNKRGKNLLHILGAHQMRVENTFFQHNQEEYATYSSIPTTLYPQGIPSMHDIFMCSQSLHKQVRDCNTILEGVISDHRVVFLKLTLTYIKVQQSHAISKGVTNWQKIQSNEHLRMVHNKPLQSMITPAMDYDEYNDAVLKAGELTMTNNKRKCEGWFQLSQATLALLLSNRNQLLHAVKCASHLPQSIQSTMQANLQCLNRHITISVFNVKAKWYAKLCLKIHNMQFNPHVAWEHIRLLAKGKTAHHQKNLNMAMQLPDGTKATSSSKNMSVFGPHFTKVFNNHRFIDPTILQHVPQCGTLWELNDPITWEEFCCAVCKLKNAKAAGLKGVPPEAFKAMSPANS
jgi:hypothetical protein